MRQTAIAFGAFDGPLTKSAKLPSGSHWLHEIKHDGSRIIARKNGERERLYSRPGNDGSTRSTNAGVGCQHFAHI